MIHYPHECAVRLRDRDLASDICAELDLEDPGAGIILLEHGLVSDAWDSLVSQLAEAGDPGLLERAQRLSFDWTAEPQQRYNRTIYPDDPNRPAAVSAPVRSTTADALEQRNWPRPILFVPRQLSGMSADDLAELAGLGTETGRHVISTMAPPWRTTDAHVHTHRPDGVYLNFPARTFDYDGATQMMEELANNAGVEFTDFLHLPDDLTSYEGQDIIGIQFGNVTLVHNPTDHMMLDAILSLIDIDNPNPEATNPRERLRRSLTRRAELRAERSRTQVSYLEQQVRQALSAYLDISQQHRQARLDSIDPQPTEADLRGIEMLERMLEAGTVERVALVGNQLSVHTSHIYIRDDRSGVWHDIGRFRMTINISEAEYHFYNLTRTIPGLAFPHHPHVDGGGKPCLGSLSDAVPQMRDNEDWPMMVEMGLAFLQSANTRDTAGRHLSDFPVVLDPEAVGLTPHENDAPFGGLPLPDEVPENGGDFGEFGKHCVLRRGGQLYYASHVGYIDGEGSMVRPIHQVTTGPFDGWGTDSILRRGESHIGDAYYFTYSDEHGTFLNQHGRDYAGRVPVREEVA